MTTWRCGECGEFTGTEAEVLEHKETCDDYRPCPGCGAEFDSAEERNEHYAKPACEAYLELLREEARQGIISPEPNRDRGYDGTGQAIAAEYTRGIQGRV